MLLGGPLQPHDVRAIVLALGGVGDLELVSLDQFRGGDGRHCRSRHDLRRAVQDPRGQILPVLLAPLAHVDVAADGLRGGKQHVGGDSLRGQQRDVDRPMILIVTDHVDAEGVSVQGGHGPYEPGQRTGAVGDVGPHSPGPLGRVGPDEVEVGGHHGRPHPGDGGVPLLQRRFVVDDRIDHRQPHPDRHDQVGQCGVGDIGVDAARGPDVRDQRHGVRATLVHPVGLDLADLVVHMRPGQRLELEDVPTGPGPFVDLLSHGQHDGQRWGGQRILDRATHDVGRGGAGPGRDDLLEQFRPAAGQPPDSCRGNPGGLGHHPDLRATQAVLGEQCRGSVDDAGAEFLLSGGHQGFRSGVLATWARVYYIESDTHRQRSQSERHVSPNGAELQQTWGLVRRRA